MRMLTGSESLLRELNKMSTPKNRGNVSAFKHATASAGSNRLLNSHHSSQQNIFEFQNGADQRFSEQPDHVPLINADNQQYQHQTQTQTSQSSLFERNSFQQFAANKLQSLQNNNEFLHLISMREKALDYRQEKERLYIKKMFKARQFSPRTYSQRKEQLERWVRLEQEAIENSKKQFK